jgi:hypothetical protein
MKSTSVNLENYSQAHLLAYLNASLNVKEMEEIDARIETDPELAATLRQLLKEKKSQELAAFQAAVVALPLPEASYAQTEREHPLSKVRQNFPKWLKKNAVKAMFLISIVGIGAAYYNYFTNDYEAIRVLTKPYLAANNLRDINDQVEGIHKEARELYLNQDYERALIKFQILLDTFHFEDNEIKFYIAICHLKLNAPKTARTILHAIDPKKDPYILYSINWYMSLAYLAEPSKENIELARKLLQEIPQTHEYGPNALDLSNQLDRLFAK